MSVTEALTFEGCNLFRQRIVYSILSGRRIEVNEIRPHDESPGVKEHEVKLLSLIEKVTNGTRVNISRTGTTVRFDPGMIHGGTIEFDCGTSRCISYFLEALVFFAPFCKSPLNVTLKGVTNIYNEISVDAIRATWLPVFNKFVLNDENLAIKIKSRGFAPDGGGVVTFTAPIVQKLRPTLREKPGKVWKFRGLAYVCKVSPSLAQRMIQSAKKTLRDYIADVYITVDQRKGAAGGNSPGFGLFLTAETTEGVFYHGEAMSVPKGTTETQLIPEEVGEKAAIALLEEIFRGGCCDLTAQPLAATFMTLGEKDVSKFLVGPLSTYTIHTLRNLRLFFEQTFKIEEYWKLHPEDEDAEVTKRIGSREKSLITGVGVGYSNLNKIIL
uniref:RNA 3'-terminal phosphate cyclase-like protein n=1 Tax=Panagrolaimus sp. PS1159 TaxID=55785 RepID=A0AC35GGM9_9BILA